MNRYLYSKILRCAIVVMVLAAGMTAEAQFRRTPKPRLTPRALGVLEIDAKGGTRLIPVMIMIEGKFYDASLYGTRPVPLSLWSETVYEAQKAGMPVGLFTVRGARRMGEKTWWAEGRWRPFNPPKKDKKDAKPGEATKDAAAEKKPETKPVMKDDDDPDRPVLKKPAGESSTASTAKEAGEKAGSAKAEKADGDDGAVKVTTSRSQDDPDRPVLRRGKREESEVESTETYEVLDPVKAKAALAAQRGPLEFLPAISDASTSDSRPFDMQLSPEEKEKYGKELAKLASDELKRFTAGRTPNPIGANATFSNVNIKSFDLDYSNNPLLVFSAEYEPAPLPTKFEPAGTIASRPSKFYVTIVGRSDYQGGVKKVFAAATDSSHLDAYPRMEFIDAVDADGDSRGELLFREIYDIGRSYAIYRASPYWSKMFEGGSGL